jgi:hypothetical protein
MQFPDILRTFVVESRTVSFFTVTIIWSVSNLSVARSGFVQERSWHLQDSKVRLPENGTAASKATTENLSGGKEKNRKLSLGMQCNPLPHLSRGYHLQKSFSLPKMWGFRSCEDTYLWLHCITPVKYPPIFFSGGGLRQEFFRGRWVQQIQLRTDSKENGDLGTVAP